MIRGFAVPLLIALTALTALGATACSYRHEKAPAESGVVLGSRDVDFAFIRERVLEPRCVKCHSEGGRAHRIPLVTYDDLLKSPRDLVLPGNPDESGLIVALTRDDEDQMPPRDGPLPAAQIEMIRAWIERGAPE